MRGFSNNGTARGDSEPGGAEDGWVTAAGCSDLERLLAAITICSLAATKIAMVVAAESEQVAGTARCESAA
jgi:hypothetical protein